MQCTTIAKILMKEIGEIGMVIYFNMKLKEVSGRRRKVYRKIGIKSERRGRQRRGSEGCAAKGARRKQRKFTLLEWPPIVT